MPKTLKIILWTLVSLSLLMVVFLATLPYLLSTTEGKEAFVSLINKTSGKTLSIEKIDLSWKGKQNIERILLLDKEQRKQFSLDSFSSSHSLFTIFFQRNLGHAIFDRPMLYIGHSTPSSPSDKGLNLSKNKKISSKKGAHIWIPLSGQITVQKGYVLLRGHNFDPIEVSDLTINLDTSKQRSLVNIVGKTEQGGMKGDILATATVEGPFDVALTLESGLFLQLKKEEKILLNLVLKKLPLPLLDQLFGLEGRGNLAEAFGSTLDLTADINIVHDSLSIATHVEAPNLKGSFRGKSLAGNFQLEEPSKFIFTFTPLFFEALTDDTNRGGKWHLATPAQITLSVNRLTFPLAFESKKFGEVITDATLSMKRAELFHERGGNYSINDLSTTLQATSLASPLRLFYTGTILGPDERGSFKGNVQLRNLFLKEGGVDASEGTGSFVFEDVSIPLNFIELLFDEKKDLSNLLGKDLSFTGKASFEKGVFAFDGAASSSRFTTDRIFLKVDDDLTLLQPALITYKITPELLTVLAIENQMLRIPEGGVMHVELESLSVPLSEEQTALDLFARKGFEVNMRFSMDSLSLIGTPILDSIWVKNFEGKLDSRSPKIINVSLSGDVDLQQTPQGEAFLPEILGPSSHFDLRFEVILDKKGPYVPTTFFSLQSDRVLADIHGTISKEGIFSLVKPGEITFLISPHRLREWPFSRDETILLEESKLTLTLSIFSFSLFPFDLKTLKLSGTGFLPQVQMTQEKHLGMALLEDIELTITLDAPKDQLLFRAKGTSKTSTREEKHKIKGEFAIIASGTSLIRGESLDLKNADVDVELSFSNFPLPVLDAWGEHEGNLLTLFGSTLDLTLKVGYHPRAEPRISFDLDASSEGFNASLAFTINGKFEVIKDRVAVIRWELTPTRYHTLLHLFREEGTFPHSDFLLINTAVVELFIEELICPSPTPDTLKQIVCQSGVVATLHVAPMNLVNQLTREQVFIQKTVGHLRGTNLSKAISLELKGKFHSHDKTSSFSMLASLLNAMTPAGEWTPKEATLKGDLKLEKLAIDTLTGIIPMQQETRTDLRALLGNEIDASVALEVSQLTGPISIDVRSNEIEASLPLYLDQGTLFLKDMVRASLKLTAPLSQTLLKDVSPLLITAASSKEPLHLYIDPKNATIPLHPFSLETINIEKAVLDLGKIEVKNGGEVQALMNFLKAKKVSETGVMEAWFTPIFLSLQGGILKCKRFDVLLGTNVHIASWGTVDLVKDKVRMILGITPETMQSKFGIIGLTQKDMFQIKMRGSTDNVKLDWSNAYTRIGIIITRTAGGGPGFLVGGLIELIGSTLGEEPTPPPTTTPFPWKQQTATRPTTIPQEAPVKPKSKGAVKRLFDYLTP